MMKNKSPLKNWLEENRWSLQAVADATGLHRQTVFLHAKGESHPKETAIAAYKEFGIPQSVLTAHYSWLINKA